MHGVSRIQSTGNVMLIHIGDADAKTMVKALKQLADAGVVVDMISQTAPMGGRIRFSFTAPYADFETAVNALGGNKDVSPMISGGYSKLYLFGEEMVDSVGVAARALDCLLGADVDISLITTSDLDISLLVRHEDEDIAIQKLKTEFGI